VTSEWYMDDQAAYWTTGERYWEDDPQELEFLPTEGGSENTRRESHETFYCGAPVEGYDNRWDLKADDPDFQDSRRRNEFDPRLITEADAEFELLLSSEHDELKSVIAHHEQVFQSISALCVLWQNGVMDANKVLKSIQNIVD